MEEQARLSKLAFGVPTPQWTTSDWPSLLGGYRQDHASIVIGEGDRQTIVVLGGDRMGESLDSVILMNVAKPKWTVGPSMIECRGELVVLVCNSRIYACGGSNDDEEPLDSIEWISVSDLLAQYATGKGNNRKEQWKMLNCRLSSPRSGCAATVVWDRYLVVVGGQNYEDLLSSVDILDTADVNHPVVFSGPEMTLPRWSATCDFIGNRIVVVGGKSGVDVDLSTIESIECSGDGKFAKTSVAEGIFKKRASWTLDKKLFLSTCWSQYAMAKMGSCLIVVGGSSDNGCESSVEVIDVDRSVVWSLPDMTQERLGCSVVALSDRILAIGGAAVSVESLSLFCAHVCFKQNASIESNPGTKRCRSAAGGKPSSSRDNTKSDDYSTEAQPDRTNKKCRNTMSIPARLQRLEDVAGNFVPVLQRVSTLEQSCGIKGTDGMTVSDRLTKMEDLLLGSNNEG